MVPHYDQHSRKINAYKNTVFIKLQKANCLPKFEKEFVNKHDFKVRFWFDLYRGEGDRPLRIKPTNKISWYTSLFKKSLLTQ